MTRLRSPGDLKYYIFVAADSDPHRLSMPSAYELASYRLKNKKWGLKATTRSVKSVRPGDYVLIYLSGRREFSQHVIAIAELASEAKPVAYSQRGRIDSPKNESNLFSEFYVEIEKYLIIKNPVDIRKVKDKLEFVKDPKSTKWGSVLQNGTLRISHADFLLLGGVDDLSIES